MLFRRTIIILISIACILSIVSCSSSSNNNVESVSENQNIEEKQAESILFDSFVIPAGYAYDVVENDDNTSVYLYKIADPEANEGFFSVYSLEKINLPVEKLVEMYCSYFDEDERILSYTNEVYKNSNGIDCLYFSFKFDDYYDDLCYVLTDDKDICVETVYFSTDSDILNGSQEVINSISN